MALDSRDISRLYAAHAEAILRFFVRRTLQPEVAVDLVGETFAQAFADRGPSGLISGLYVAGGPLVRRSRQQKGVPSPGTIAVTDVITARPSLA